MANIIDSFFTFYKKPYVRIPLLILLGLILLWGIIRSCSSEMQRKDYFKIGRDVTWYPLELQGKDQNMIGFTNDLFDQIARTEGIKLEIFDVTSKSLFFGLDRGNWEGALVSIPADVFNKQKYEFSIPFYTMGYVLLAPMDSSIKSFSDISGKIIGMLKDQSLDPSIARHDAIFTPYQRMSKAMEDLYSNRLDAVIVDYVSAQRYIQGVYAKKIKMVTTPTKEDSLRLIAKKGTEGAYLIKHFNNGLEKLMKDGSYEKMLIKWSLSSAQ